MIQIWLLSKQLHEVTPITSQVGICLQGHLYLHSNLGSLKVVCVWGFITFIPSIICLSVGLVIGLNITALCTKDSLSLLSPKRYCELFYMWLINNCQIFHCHLIEDQICLTVDLNWVPLWFPPFSNLCAWIHGRCKPQLWKKLHTEKFYTWKGPLFGLLVFPGSWMEEICGLLFLWVP